MASATLLAGCTSMNAAPTTFEGTHWQVTAINGRATPSTDRYRVRFSNGQIGGQFGCNNFGASYRAGGAMLTVGPLAATEIACSGEAGQFEQWGFAVLGQPMRIDWQSDQRLTLGNTSGSIALHRTP
jgi:heat shock protein HslJ